MNNLRILLVEDDPARTERVLSLFASSEHPPVCVHTVSEAAEALLVQKFDITLLTSSGSAKEVPDFAARLRASETQAGAGSRIAVFSCFAEQDGIIHSDGCLPGDFTSEDVERAFARFQHSVQSGGASRQTS